MLYKGKWILSLVLTAQFVVAAYNAVVRGNLRPCRDSVGKNSVINECCLQRDKRGSNGTPTL